MDIKWIKLNVMFAVSTVYLSLIQPLTIPPFSRSTGFFVKVRTIFPFRQISITSGGGLAAVIYVDVVQVTIMILGSSLVLYKGLEEVGGWNALQEK